MGAYTLAEASRAVSVPSATLRWWVRGRDPYPPAIKLPDSSKPVLSYINLIEAHILAGLRTIHGVPLQNVRNAIEYCEQKLGVRHALAYEKFQTDGVSLFVDRLGSIINATRGGQIEMREVIESYLTRVEYDAEGSPIRFFPLVRHGRDFETQPALISVDPFVAFGRPVIARTRIPTDVIYERFLAGESVDELARDYDQEKTAIEEAIRYEQAA